ncbi:disease resistance protein RPS5-like [Aegilops tauschii subsp. strangulata]|uniref:disease resistance protein RPS5-like n=1 Tax=Aegilops tauschii subsp. strangulata TaxID=200361 RepID=UPI003CC89CAA
MELDTATWISIAAICASILMAIKWWDPITVHLGYSYSVHLHVEDLGRKVKMLSDMQIDLRYQDPFPSSAERIRWLQSIDGLQNKEKEIKNRLEMNRLENPIVSYFKRCPISWEAHRELNKANDLISQGDKLLPEVKASPLPVRHVQQQELRAPLPGMEDSYKKVLNFIKDNSARSAFFGVWGMGGVGKTTLINLVSDSRSKYHDDFAKVLFVQAVKGFTTVADLQKAIAISIAIPQIGNQISQAHIIHNHLRDKSFLLLVDDLWEDLDLDEVGIPSLDAAQPHRRKVVFTTRSMYVCSKMGCCCPEDTIQMKCLSKQDAWNLFTQKVGSKIFDDEEIHELAEEFLSRLKELRELAIVASFHSQKVLEVEGGPTYNQCLLPYLEMFELDNLLKLEKVGRM